MPASPSPSRISRVRAASLVVALAAVGLAARGRDQQTTVPPQTTPQAPQATVNTGTDSVAQPDSVADSLAVQDSLAPLQVDSIQPDKYVAATPVQAPAPAWPVDPVTGQTLINGKPVVGRVFIMRKTDGLTKFETVADVQQGEPVYADAPIVGTSYKAPALEHTRRHRGIMVQATLWDLDTKQSAVERRYYRDATPANQLPQ